MRCLPGILLLAGLLYSAACAPRDTTELARESGNPPRVDSIVTSEGAYVTDLPEIVTEANRSVDTLTIGYALDRDFASARLEFVTIDGVSAAYPLPVLTAGTHVMQVPPGILVFPESPVFSCDIGRMPGLTLRWESLWSDPGEFPFQSPYNYAPDSGADRVVSPSQAFVGSVDPAIISWAVDWEDNAERRENDAPLVIEVLGVHLRNGLALTCVSGDPLVRAAALLSDVRVVWSSAESGVPALHAAKLTLPNGLLAPTWVQISGTPASSDSVPPGSAPPQ